MKVQQLLLLALVGPFCAFTLASPTVFPTSVMETSEVPFTTGEPVIVTGPPEPTPVPDLVEKALPSVEAETELISVVVTKYPEASEAPETSEAPEAPEAHSTEVPDASPTEGPSEEITTLPGETTVYAVEPAGPTQEAPGVETAAPVDPAESVEVTEESEDVIIDEPEGGLGSGQIIGIVIGALVAVVIVIAVVIAVVRRMGKYSSAKNQKPAKKDSSLKKKSTKQQEHAKFWKF